MNKERKSTIFKNDYQNAKKLSTHLL